jgi:hypothetical protein
MIRRKLFIILIILLAFYAQDGFCAYSAIPAGNYAGSTDITNPQWERSANAITAKWDASLANYGDSSVVFIPIEKGFEHAALNYSAYSTSDSVYVASYYGYSTTAASGATIRRVEDHQDSLLYWYKEVKHVTIKKPNWLYPRAYLVIVTRGTSKNAVTITYEVEVFLKEE